MPDNRFAMSGALDRYITGNYGEDQFRGECVCDECGRHFENVVAFEEHDCPAEETAAIRQDMCGYTEKQVILGCLAASVFALLVGGVVSVAISLFH